MKNNSMIPFYGIDGSSLGFRELHAAKRLVAAGTVKPAYGRKGHLKAIFEQQEDGGTPVRDRPSVGAGYSYRQRLARGGRCWSLRQLDLKDEDGEPFSTRPAFMNVVRDCMA